MMSHISALNTIIILANDCNFIRMHTFVEFYGTKRLKSFLNWQWVLSENYSVSQSADSSWLLSQLMRLGQNDLSFVNIRSF